MENIKTIINVYINDNLFFDLLCKTHSPSIQSGIILYPLHEAIQSFEY